MSVREIARRRIGGVWRTVDVEEDSGGSSALSVIGPHAVNYDTAGFMNPNDNGVATLAVPTGTVLVKAFAVITAPFTGADVGDGIVLALLTTANGNGPPVASYSGQFFRDPDVGVCASEPKPQVAFDSVFGGSSAVALGDCHIFAAYFPNATPPSAGSIDVYALVQSQ